MTEIWTPGFIAGTVKMGQLMAIIALGLFIAQSRPVNLRFAAPVLLAFVAIGAVLAYLTQAEAVTLILLFAATVLAGGIVATGFSFGTPASLLLAAAIALVLGMASRPDGGRFPDQWIVLLVNVAGAVIIPLLIAIICRRLHVQTGGAKIASIGIRIAASWDTAIAAMMVALIGTQIS